MKKKIKPGTANETSGTAAPGRTGGALAASTDVTGRAPGRLPGNPANPDGRPPEGGPSPTPSSCGGRCSRWYLPGLVTGLVLAVNLLTLAPTVTFVDSGELALCCASRGVAHPPGMPFYVMLGHLFNQLPAGSAAWRAGLLSALAAALAAGFVTWLVRLVLEGGAGTGQPAKKQRPSKSKKSHPGLAPEDAGESANLGTTRWIPLAAGLLAGFSRTWWSYAVVVEVYTLQTLLMAAVLALLLAWRGRRQAGRDGNWLLPSAGLLFGLSLGVHHVTSLIWLPAFLILVFHTAGWRILQRREGWLAAAAVLGGAGLVYLYLPLAAAAQPVLNWGDPGSWSRFWRHVTGWQYQSNLFDQRPEEIRAEWNLLGRILASDLTPAGGLLAAAGLLVCWWRDRWLAVALTATLLLNGFFGLHYTIAEDKDAYYLPMVLIMALLASCGLHWIWTRAARTGLAGRRLLLAGTLALPLLAIGLHFRTVDRHGFYLARRYVTDTLRTVGPGGLLLTGDWQLYSPWLYYRHVEGFRPDALVVDFNLLRRSWYLRQYLPRHYPALMTACREEAETFGHELDRFEQGRPYDPNRIQTAFTGLLNAMIRHVQPGAGAALTLPVEAGVGTGFTWIPEGLVMRLAPASPVPAAATPADFPGLDTSGLPAIDDCRDEVARAKVLPAYAIMLANRGRYLTLQGRVEEALACFGEALRIHPGFDRTHEFLGELYLQAQDLPKARGAFQQALRLNPQNAAAAQALMKLSGR